MESVDEMRRKKKGTQPLKDFSGRRSLSWTKTDHLGPVSKVGTEICPSHPAIA